MKRINTLMLMMLLCISSMFAAQVTVKMNTTSRTMKLENKATGATVSVGEPTSYAYTFTADAGTYLLTSYASDGTTVNGTLEINVTNDAEQTFTVQTCTAYVTNKNADGVAWEYGKDYTIDLAVSGKDGSSRVITLGNSTTAGRKTFNVLNGDSYIASFVPSADHAAEGYLPLEKTGTVTANPTISGAIPVGADLVVTAPSDAQFVLATKSTHFVDYKTVEPKSVAEEGANKVYTYYLADAQQYNYRTWKEGGVTNAGVIKMFADEAKRPSLNFTSDDYATISPSYIDRDVTSNSKYNVADIFVNINERGHLKLNQGDTFDAMAYRSWEVIDGITSNYFIEPDYHYTILNLNGEKDNSVITVEQGQAGSHWATLKAVGNGTAIVLVTYDALVANQYTDAAKKDALGGQNWSAIWPENTAAYVVTVGQPSTAIIPNMTVNAGKNTTNLKLAGNNVDAECDVFYYLKGEAGYKYTFAPEGVAKVEIAYPTIGAQMATYNGFDSKGVAMNADGSYTVLLKQGRQIVKLTDASGNSEYQVLTAKEVSYTLSNLTNAESETFAAGDKVAVLFSTLYHPANKLAGIHNFNTTIEYGNLPEGVKAVKGKANQYQFAGTETAQTYTVTLPADWDGETPLTISGGALRLGGFGDPIGNHRGTSRANGRNANFTAVQNTSLLCVLPEITIPEPTALQIATLENDQLDYLALDADSHIPELTEDFDNEVGYQAGDFWFDMNTYSDWSTWWGYGVANHKATSFNSLADQYNSITGGGVDGSENYGVAYITDFMGPVYATLTTDEASVVPGVYVTNAAYAFESMLHGDSFSKKFGNGDWFKLTAIGYDDDEEETGRKDFYLADLRSENSADWYIINDWQYMDLSSLGKVRQIQFTLSSTDNGDWGMNTPAYFCFDNLGAKGFESTPKGNIFFLADKNEYKVTADTDCAILTYTRTFGTTNWQPLFVPFASVCSDWGNNVEIAKATNQHDDFLTITKLEDNETVNAHTPYFIRAAETGDYSASLINATLKAVPASLETVIEGITFQGVYSQTEIDPDNYVLHKGEIMANNNTYTLEPMRWYISNATAGAKMQIIVEGEEASAIHNANASASQSVIYNINGVKQSALQRGINIIRKADGTVVKVLK